MFNVGKKKTRTLIASSKTKIIACRSILFGGKINILEIRSFLRGLSIFIFPRKKNRQQRVVVIQRSFLSFGYFFFLTYFLSQT